MRVIQDNSKGWTLRVVCRDCKSELDIQKEDLKRGMFGGNYAERGNEKLYISCPVCKADNSMLDNMVPPFIQRYVKERLPRP